MWQVLSGRRHALDTQQADVSRALTEQRDEMRRLTAELDEEVQGLRGSDARMMLYLGRMRHEASRSKKVAHP